MVLRRLALYQRQDARVALVASGLRVASTGSPGLDLASTVFFLIVSLPCEMHH